VGEVAIRNLPPYRPTVSRTIERPRHVLAGTDPAFDHPLAVRRRDAGAVIIDHDRQPLRRRAVRVEPRAHRDPRATPFAGVVEEVAEQLEDIATIAEKS